MWYTKLLSKDNQTVILCKQPASRWVGVDLTIHLHNATYRQTEQCEREDSWFQVCLLCSQSIQSYLKKNERLLNTWQITRKLPWKWSCCHCLHVYSVMTRMLNLHTRKQLWSELWSEDKNVSLVASSKNGRCISAQSLTGVLLTILWFLRTENCAHLEDDARNAIFKSTASADLRAT